MKRINRYMTAEELDPTAVTHHEANKDAVVVTINLIPMTF
jgi:hypothetical protein